MSLREEARRIREQRKDLNWHVGFGPVTLQPGEEREVTTRPIVQRFEGCRIVTTVGARANTIEVAGKKRTLYLRQEGGIMVADVELNMCGLDEKITFAVKNETAVVMQWAAEVYGRALMR